MSAIVHVKFIQPVDIGGRPIEYWSKKRGETDELLGKITVRETPDKSIWLTWTGGKTPTVIEVYASNVSQVEREPVEAVPVKDAKR